MLLRKSKCKHLRGFTFKKTKLGVKRTCKQRCGFSVTEVGIERGSILDIPWKNRRPKGKHLKDD